MADRWKHNVRMRQSDCENLLEWGAKDRHSGSGAPDNSFLLDVGKGNRIVYTFQADVVIEAHRCRLPSLRFKNPDRQRTQECLSSAKPPIQPPSHFWKDLWPNASRQAPITLFRSNRGRNWLFRSIVFLMMPRYSTLRVKSSEARSWKP